MKIGIVGMGLMGASLAKALMKYTSHEVYGLDMDVCVLEKASADKAFTRALADGDFKTVDMVVFALRPKAAIDEMRRICPRLKDGAIVADICGVKRFVADGMREIAEYCPNLHFISVHPMAGKEFGGYDNSTPDLFADAYVIIVNVNCDSLRRQIVTDMFTDVGARGIQYAGAEEHDRMIAYTSQLAHATSGCYVQNPLSSAHAGYSAGSFKDLTRVARLDADMWTELFLENGDNLISCIDDIMSRFAELRKYLADKDESALREFLMRSTRCKTESEKAEKEWKQ